MSYFLRDIASNKKSMVCFASGRKPFGMGARVSNAFYYCLMLFVEIQSCRKMNVDFDLAE